MITSKHARLLGFASVFGLAMSSGLFAQDQSSTDAEGQAAIPLQDNLSLGEDANAQPQAGQPYVKEEVGDFALRCVRTETGENEPCQLYQLVLDQDQQPVVEFSMFRLPEGGRAIAGATLVAPLETALQQQVTISIDGGTARRYPFAFCNAIGCYARIGFTNEDVSAFKRGNLAKITIVPVIAPDQKVELNMSLTGFTAGFDKASVLDNPG